MKLIELQKYDDYSVILRQDDEGKALIVSPFVVAVYPNIQDGEVIDWAWGHYFEDLFSAVNYARTRTETYHPNYYRLEEIASKVIYGLVQDDKETAYEYFAREVEMDSHEAEYFGLNVELLEDYK